MRFYVGLHQSSDAKHFERCMVSVNRLRDRKGPFQVREWMMDSGAFSELKDHGHYRHSVREYADEVLRWCEVGQMAAAVSQDYMCEPFILAKTGLTTQEHQRLTIERYRKLADLVGDRVYVLPVLQGYWPDEYLSHLGQYGSLLARGQWVGVGSVCKRNVDIEAIEQVLVSIHRARPDLQLHGFGVKTTALESSLVRECLYSADSMAWSFAERRGQGNANDWRAAKRFVDKIESQKVTLRHFQPQLF